MMEVVLCLEVLNSCQASLKICIGALVASVSALAFTVKHEIQMRKK